MSERKRANFHLAWQSFGKTRSFRTDRLARWKIGQLMDFSKFRLKSNAVHFNVPMKHDYDIVKMSYALPRVHPGQLFGAEPVQPFRCVFRVEHFYTPYKFFHIYLNIISRKNHPSAKFAPAGPAVPKLAAWSRRWPLSESCNRRPVSGCTTIHQPPGQAPFLASRFRRCAGPRRKSDRFWRPCLPGLYCGICYVSNFN